MYQLTQAGLIRRLADNAIISLDLRNKDYRAFLDWVAHGGIPQPAPVQPSSVPTCNAWQMRAALNQLGWRAAVEAAVASSPNQDLRDGWAHIQEFHRNHAWIAQIATSIGKTDVDLDNLFAIAVTKTP